MNWVGSVFLKERNIIMFTQILHIYDQTILYKTTIGYQKRGTGSCLLYSLACTCNITLASRYDNEPKVQIALLSW